MVAEDWPTQDEFDEWLWAQGFEPDNIRSTAFCGRGWWRLLEPALRAIKQSPDSEIYQIKEKFGTLRLYYGRRNSPEIEEAVREAERQSFLTCEVCGAPGLLRGGGWLKTLCDTHAAGRKEVVIL